MIRLIEGEEAGFITVSKNPEKKQFVRFRVTTIWVLFIPVYKSKRIV